MLKYWEDTIRDSPLSHTSNQSRQLFWNQNDQYVFSYIDIWAILSDDRINNRAVKTLIMKIAEEWIMINLRGFEENETFQRIQSLLLSLFLKQ